MMRAYILVAILAGLTLGVLVAVALYDIAHDPIQSTTEVLVG